jgi:vacuolar-type H+-ATPase subunit F/Vma7
MKPLVIGTREDVAGFALAGVAGVVCASREEAERAIARADAETLLIVSAQFADLRNPLLVALPSRM